MLVKYSVFFLILTSCILLSSQVTAYTVTSTQTQAVSTSTETNVEVGTTIESSSEVSQEQKQRSGEPKVRREDATKQRLQGSTESRENLNIQQVRERRGQAASASATATECAAIKGRLDAHIAAFTKNYQKREEKYKRIYETLQGLISRLQEKGTAVDELLVAATKLQKERMELLASLDSYILTAEQVRGLSCDANSGDRRARFAELRTARDSYEKELRDVVSVINTQVKPALKSVQTTVEANQ